MDLDSNREVKPVKKCFAIHLRGHKGVSGKLCLSSRTLTNLKNWDVNKRAARFLTRFQIGCKTFKLRDAE